MITSEEAKEITASVAALSGKEPVKVDDWRRGLIERPRGESGRPLTGWRFVRGSHGGSWRRDPTGTDVPGPYDELPPADEKAA